MQQKAYLPALRVGRVSRWRKGFTLLEILTVLGILGLLAGAVYALGTVATNYTLREGKRHAGVLENTMDADVMGSIHSDYGLLDSEHDNNTRIPNSGQNRGDSMARHIPVLHVETRQEGRAEEWLEKGP